VSAGTRVVPTGARNGYAPGQWIAQYWDAEFRVWFDIGDPRDHRAAAEDLAAEHEAARR
jgi:hypothetical protein